jgi:RNA polymerase sigma-70 factor, ECF subfamily
VWVDSIEWVKTAAAARHSSALVSGRTRAKAPDSVMQAEGRPSMSPSEHLTSSPVAKEPQSADATGISDALGRCHTEQQRDRMNDDIRDEMVRLLPRLRKFAFSLCRDHDKCNDLVQEACTRALARLDQWQPGTRFDSWMFRIAQNIWFDRMRSEKSRGQVVDIDAAYDVVDTDGRVVTESSLTLQEVMKGISRLPADQQVLIALVCVDGMSYKEAAEVLELPIGTVMSRLSRARLALHEDVFGAETGDKPTVSESKSGRVVR